MEGSAKSSLIIKIKNKNVLKWLTYYVHRKLLRDEGFFIPNNIMATWRGDGGLKVLKMYYIVYD